MVTICTTSLTFNNSTFCPHSVFMCFVWIWEQTATISLYSTDWFVLPVNKQWNTSTTCTVSCHALHTSQHWKWIGTKFGPKVFQSSTRRSDPYGHWNPKVCQSSTRRSEPCVHWGPKVCQSSTRRSDPCVPWGPKVCQSSNRRTEPCVHWASKVC